MPQAATRHADAGHAGLGKGHVVDGQQRNDDAVANRKFPHGFLPVAEGPEQAVQQQQYRALALVHIFVPVLVLAAQFHLRNG